MLRNNDVIKGTYRVIREIGHGGTGVVYLGYHINLRKPIVLKRITAEIRDENMLRREADVLKNLRHPCIPQIYDFLIENGDVFTVMDFIEGQSLDEYIKTAGALSEDQLLQWFKQLTDVLIYLQSGRIRIIHSDIKPGNIMITPQGLPMLIDFNISIDQNQAGKMAGFSPNYASPEQAWMASELNAGRKPKIELDGRTDIYSLGAVFYMLISGITPDCRTRLPRLETLPGVRCSLPFVSIIDKCIQWDREDRYRNAAALGNALKNLYKLDKRYRQSLIMRLSAGAVCVLLFAGGVFSTAHGFHQVVIDNVDNKLSQIALYTQSGNYQAAGQEASELLGKWEYKTVLKDDPRKAELYHVVGDANWLQAGVADDESCYRNAADNYLEAVKISTNTGSDRLPDYCADLALAYQKCGDNQGLANLVAYCQENGITGVEMDLAQAALNNEGRDRNNLQASVNAILDSNSSGDSKARACILMADSYEDGSREKIEYLEKAAGYSGEKKYLRMYASEEYRRAGKQDLSDSERQSCASKAASGYRKLCDTPSPDESDIINLGIASYMAGQFQDSVDAMASARKYSDRYEIYMYMALSYEAMGDKANAGQYCADALRRCEGQNSEKSVEDMRVLESLMERL